MPRLISPTSNRIATYAFMDDWKGVDARRSANSQPTIRTLAAIDLHKELKKSGAAMEVASGVVLKTEELKRENLDTPLDLGKWLPFSAPHYHISRNLDDYVLVPVIIMPSDIPNRNSVAFPRHELVKFHPHLGQQAYGTWKGKPTHYEHANEDITQAYGVIADTFMRKLPMFNGGLVWKVLLLLAFDRSKNTQTINKVISGELNSYSMGAYIGGYTCSYCNAKLGDCKHIDPKNPHMMYELNGKLVFRNVVDIEGFECSIVASPAYVSAISDTLIQVIPKEDPLPRGTTFSPLR